MEDLKKFPIGGVHLPEEKHLTTDSPIEDMDFPELVTIPLQMHIGAPCEPVVSEGEEVQRGQVIARNDEALSALIHASISGVYRGIESRPGPDDSMINCMVIENQGQSHDEMTLEPEYSFDELDKEKIVNRVKNAGIVGLGGACFPTHVKLSPPDDKPIDTVIINGAECEPYLTVDDRLMREKTELLFQGLQLIMKASGAEKGIVSSEINKPKAVEAIREEAENWDNLDGVPLDTRYPHGAEKHLIKAVLDREVPRRGLPMDVGVIVNNVQTTTKIAEALYRGRTLIDRVLTVSGRALQDQKNLAVPVGTPIKDVIDYCGGTETENYYTIMGGPMTGKRVEKMQIPVGKGTSLVVLSEEEYNDPEKRVCIKCGKCVDVCPMYLPPNRITAFVNNEMYKEAEIAGLNDCIECGACAFVCPAKRPLVRWIQRGKAAADS
ncbi:electron transport complex subunit RsxC [Halarsenatibacter silvermanii]|uniref:Ion-translocating oxidoreductase complex subunit C n=1 Tax=Halarsenatibacter silvermanii TaxID=321763 RepID=A0A1G9LMW2_9FIRM|nr:electron transport complex subunit RsxC [Halarsenatibacter silvermanii]SDL63339.1 electron transport complex protein RnfC [Halarsenatibacter silvermanii]